MRLFSVFCLLIVIGGGEIIAQDMEYDSIEPSLDKIVVLPYRNRTQVDSLTVLEDRIALAISNRLLSTGRVLIAGRDEIQAVMDTLVPGQGYITNERQAFRIGVALNARKVVFGSFAPVGSGLSIKTYLVDCIMQNVHTVEQLEPVIDLRSDQMAIETARVVQGQIIGVTPREEPTIVTPDRKPRYVSDSPVKHLPPWLSLGVTLGLGYMTLNYDSKLSDTWDDYLTAVEDHEITRLYNKASDYLLARNALAVLTLGGAATAVYYWFANDYGGSEQWSAGSPDDTGWSARPVNRNNGWGVTVTKRF